MQLHCKLAYFFTAYILVVLPLNSYNTAGKGLISVSTKNAQEY